MHCHISLYLQTTADQLSICTVIFQCICCKLQNKWIIALSHFKVFTDIYRKNKYMHCHISFYLQTTKDQMNIHTARIPCFYGHVQKNSIYALQLFIFYRKLQNKSIYAFPHFILFTEKCRKTQYMLCNISLYLQETADQNIICTATFHCIYRQLSKKEYIHCHISFYLQKTADPHNIFTATFHCIYRQLQTN